MLHECAQHYPPASVILPYSICWENLPWNNSSYNKMLEISVLDKSNWNNSPASPCGIEILKGLCLTCFIESFIVHVSQVSPWTTALWRISCCWHDVDLLCQVPLVLVTKPYSTIRVGSTWCHQKGSSPCFALYSDPLLMPGTLVHDQLK